MSLIKSIAACFCTCAWATYWFAAVENLRCVTCFKLLTAKQANGDFIRELAFVACALIMQWPFLNSLPML